MADYQAFERDYPTLNKFVGAAREAASVIPGAGYLTPGGQNYQDARRRFQQENPMTAAAGRGVGYGVVAAALGGTLGALGRGAASRGVMSEAAGEAAAGGRLGALAEQGLSDGTVAAQAARAASLQPRFVMPTVGNLAQGASNAATVAGPALSAAAGYGKTALNYAPIAAPVLGPMLAQAVHGNGQQPASGHVNGFDGSAGNFTQANVRQQTPEQALAAMNPQSGAAPAARGGQQNMSAMPMFPGDDPSKPLGLRLLMAKLSPRPHYASASDRAIDKGMTMAQALYDEEMRNAKTPEDQAKAKDKFFARTSQFGRNAGGTFSQLTGYAPQAPADEGPF